MTTNQRWTYTRTRLPSLVIALQYIQILVSLMERENTCKHGPEIPNKRLQKECLNIKVGAQVPGIWRCLWPCPMSQTQQSIWANNRSQNNNNVEAHGQRLASRWFRMLTEDLITDFDYIIEDFLSNFTRWGNKWNLAKQLFSIKQEAKELVRDSICYTKNFEQ